MSGCVNILRPERYDRLLADDTFNPQRAGTELTRFN